MSYLLEIRICKESFIQEMERMYHPSKKAYFQQVVDYIANEAVFNVASTPCTAESYERFMHSLKRHYYAQHDYYNKSSEIMKFLLGCKEARIWTKKETMEIQEWMEQFSDPRASRFFNPLFHSLKQGQTFICLLKENQEKSIF